MVNCFNCFSEDFQRYREYEKLASQRIEEKYGVETWLNTSYDDKSFYDFKDSRGFYYEVKYDGRSKETGNYYIEYEAFYKPSGISITKSDYYIICDGEVFVMIPTEELKTYIVNTNPRIISCLNGRGISKGYLVKKSEILPHAILL